MVFVFIGSHPVPQANFIRDPSVKVCLENWGRPRPEFQTIPDRLKGNVQ
jgi:hypothetical protein